MRTLLLLLLAGGLAAAQECADGAEACDAPAVPADPATVLDGLAKARDDLKVARTEFKRLARVEQDAIRDARERVAATRQGAALAPALGALSDLLERAAAEEDKKLGRFLKEMVATSRAMAAELDQGERHLAAELRAKKPAERAPETAARARELVAAARAEECGEEIAAACRILRSGDPRLQSLARNRAALDQAFTLLIAGQRCGGSESATALKSAKELHESLAFFFTGVETERPPPAEALPAP